MNLKFSSVAATQSNPNWNNLISRKDELYKKENDVRSEFERDYDRIIMLMQQVTQSQKH